MKKNKRKLIFSVSDKSILLKLIRDIYRNEYYLVDRIKNGSINSVEYAYIDGEKIYIFEVIYKNGRINKINYYEEN